MGGVFGSHNPTCVPLPPFTGQIEHLPVSTFELSPEAIKRTSIHLRGQVLAADEIMFALLGRGYFPKELPPVFTTKDFGSDAREILVEWQTAKLFKPEPAPKLTVAGKGKVSKGGAYTYKLPTPEAEAISCPKKGYERRNVHITHPIPQALLVQEIADNRSTIAKWLARGRFSLDRVQIASSYGRGMKPLNFRAHQARKAYIEAQSDWIVKTDITRFFPSIYTHSIPWASYGKEVVKSNPKKFIGSLADRLDILVRSCNRNQTIGIPVGPETSRVLADIISSRIDADFAEKVKDIDEAYVDRLQDDWFLGAPSLEAAEAALSTITSCYRDYGLDINGSKTDVLSTLSPLSETWVAELGAFLSHSRRLTRTRLREFLYLTLKLQLEYPKDPVVSYSLSVIESRRGSIGDVEALESFLIRAATVAPGAMSRICSILINLHHDTKRVSLERVQSRFMRLAERNLQKGNLYEVIWILFTLRGLQIPLKSKTFCDAVEGVPSSAIILLLLDLNERGQVWKQLPISSWENVDADRVLSDWSWLYAYEGIRKGWLADKNGLLAHPFFAAMANRDVVFYDPKRNVRRTTKTVELRQKEWKSSFIETLQLISNLRGFDSSDYDN